MGAHFSQIRCCSVFGGKQTAKKNALPSKKKKTKRLSQSFSRSVWCNAFGNGQPAHQQLNSLQETLFGAGYRSEGIRLIGIKTLTKVVQIFYNHTHTHTCLVSKQTKPTRQQKTNPSPNFIATLEKEKKNGSINRLRALLYWGRDVFVPRYSLAQSTPIPPRNSTDECRATGCV